MPWWLLWKRKVQGADVARLEAWEPGGPSVAGGDFRGARLRARQLSNVNLRNANLTNADLRQMWPRMFDPVAAGAKLIDK